MGARLPDQRELGRYFALAQIGLEMVVPIAGGVLLDNYLGWSPWGAAAGAVLGLVGGLAHLLHLLKRFESKDSSSQQDSH